MSSAPKTQEGKRAKEVAKDVVGKCAELGRAGDIKGASRLLHKSVREHFNIKRSNGQAGQGKFREAALHLLWQCNFHKVQPPVDLIQAYEIMDGVKMDDILERDRLIEFAAGFKSVDDVSVRALARECEAIKRGVPATEIVDPDRKTARTRKADPEFREQVEEAKARETTEYREKRKNAAGRAKGDEQRFNGLREVVEKAAREPIAGLKKPQN